MRVSSAAESFRLGAGEGDARETVMGAGGGAAAVFRFDIPGDAFGGVEALIMGFLTGTLAGSGWRSGAMPINDAMRWTTRPTAGAATQPPVA